MLLEQPSSSLMKYHPRAVILMECYPMCFQNTFLGAWGHWCPKLTSFYGNRCLGCFLFAAVPEPSEVTCDNQPNVRQWISEMYRKFTQEKRDEAEQRRARLGLEKPTKKDGDGRISGTKSLRATQTLGDT